MNQRFNIADFGPDENPSDPDIPPRVEIGENEDDAIAFVQVFDDDLDRIGFQWRILSEDAQGGINSENLNNAQEISDANRTFLITQIRLNRNDLARYDGGTLRCFVTDTPVGSTEPEYQETVSWEFDIVGDKQ
ncbi:MAG: hypothetical protein AAFV53_22700 [Myxococcota bacterium]